MLPAGAFARDPLRQVGDGILDERSDGTCDLIPAVVHQSNQTFLSGLTSAEHWLEGLEAQ